MGFLRRLFARKKRTAVEDDPLRLGENELERIWVAGWKHKKRARLSHPFTRRNDNDWSPPESLKVYDDLCFDDAPAKITSPLIAAANAAADAVDSNTDQAAITPVQLSHDRANITCAAPPLKKIPGALLSFPRFQEYICAFMKDAPIHSTETEEDSALENGRSGTSTYEENQIVQPISPSGVKLRDGPKHNAGSCLSLTASLAESVVPSLVYSEVSISTSTNSANSSTDTSCTSPSLVSKDSFFNSTSIPSYFRKRRVRTQLRRAERSRHRPRDRREANDTVQESALPTVQHANTYAGLRSMAGPYPCITSRSRASSHYCNTIGPGSLSNCGYYP